MARLGRKPQKYYFPNTNKRYYWELQKLPAQERQDYIGMLSEGGATRQARYIFDRCVTGFCLPTGQGDCVWPAHKDDGLKDEVFGGLEEDELTYLFCAMWIQNDIWPAPGHYAAQLVLRDGKDNTPAFAEPAIDMPFMSIQDAEKAYPGIMDQMRDALGDDLVPHKDDVLGNSPRSSIDSSEPSTEPSAATTEPSTS